MTKDPAAGSKCRKRHGPARSSCLLALLLVGCGAGSDGDSTGAESPSDDPTVSVSQTGASSFDPDTGYRTPADVDACSSEDINAWIEHDMHDYYVYSDRVTPERLSDYTDPNTLVQALRVAPDTFSGVRDTISQVAQFEDGVFFGYGLWLYFNDAGELRFRDIVPNSPMDTAGVRRGDILLGVNGTAVADLSDAQWDEVFTADRGVASVFRIRTGVGAPRELTVARDDYATVTTHDAVIHTLADGSRVGYLGVTRFLDRTAGDVDVNLEWLAHENIDRLVLDLRYNGGGRSVQAERLGSQLIGSAFNGQTYQRYTFNDTYTADNFTRSFDAPGLTLPVLEIAILTTGATASASEALANGLRPYTNVTIIGDTTAGKPFASWRVDHCGLSLNAMRVITSNANGVTVSGGIEPDCLVADQWNVETTSADDALHRAALDYFAYGTCPTTPLAKQAGQAAELYPEASMFAVPANE